jgi:hypothetical protein
MRFARLLGPFCLGFVTTIVCLSQAPAQEPSAITKEHQWLHQFVGEWESTGKATAAPGEAAMTCKGKVTTRKVGGLWVVSEIDNEMMGTKVEAIQTFGYDPEKKKFVGTWVDSMLDHMWKYEGTVDEGGKKITFEADGPNFFAPGKTAKFRDAYEFKSKDLIETTSSMQTEDGKWTVFMTGQMKRTK